MTALNGVARTADRVQEASWAVKSGYEGRFAADERQLSAVCSTAKNDRQKTRPSTTGWARGATLNASTSSHATTSRAAIHAGDRQLRRTCVRFGEEFREIRLRAGVSQAAVARAIGVARSVICRLEQGDPDVSPRIRARAASALGADIRISIYAEGAPLIHDAAHARIVEAVLALIHPSWRVTLESPIPGPGRRSSDLRLDRDLDIVLLEVESRVRAVEAIIREGAEKRAAVAASVGPERRLHAVLVLPPTRHHKSLVAAHPRIVTAAFPAAQDALLEALTTSAVPWPGDGILWVAPDRGWPTASKTADRTT
jgi:transcriptional regulator with XRE-family HTH domain